MSADDPQVIPIDPKGKYIIIFPMRLTDEEIQHARESIDEWWEGEGSGPFLLADGGIKLVRVDGHDEEETESS